MTKAVPHISGWFSPVLAAFVLFSGPNPAGVGAPIAADVAARAAVNWLGISPKPMGRSVGSPGAQTRTFSAPSGEPQFYVVDLAPTGYVVLASDDQLEPIIAFSHKDHFVGKAGNPLFDLLQRDLGARKSQLAKAAASSRSGSPAITARNSKWHQLLAVTPRSSSAVPQAKAKSEQTIDDPRVDPLIQTEWDQTTVGSLATYNYYTPPHAAGNPGNYPSGCTATAWAQIMFYHQWPATGVGTRSFPVVVNGMSEQRALRGGTGDGGPYLWNQMVPVPDSTLTVQQARAIGALVADAGVANQADYEAGGSAANLYTSVIKNVFKYANCVMSAVNPSFSAQSASVLGDANLAIDTNLDANLPVWMTIWDSSVGHAVVVDGYGYNGTTLYHHLNMGWSGADDAWYNLPTVDLEGTGYDFNILYYVIYNIDPTIAGEIVSGRLTDSDGNPVAGIPVVAKSGGQQYSGTSNARGIYAIKGLPSSTTFTVAPEAQMSSAPESSQVRTGVSWDQGPVGNRTGINFQVNFSPPPTVPAPTGISTAGATLNGTVSPDGMAWTAYFQYGTTTQYGSETPTVIIASGTSVTPFSATLTNLAPDTTYHYRAVVTNSEGTLYSPDATFTTPAYDLFTVAAQSGTAPGIAAARFTTFGSPSINDQNHVAFQATTSYGNSGIWADSGTNQSLLVALTGSAAPGVANTTFKTLGDPLYNSADQVAFIGALNTGEEGFVKANATGIWANTSGTLGLVALTGTQAPGCPDAVFTAFEQLVLTDQGGVIFVAALGNAGPQSGVTSANDVGIWADDGTGQLRLVIRKGASAPFDNAVKVTGLSLFADPAVTKVRTQGFNSSGKFVYKVAYGNGKVSVCQTTLNSTIQGAPSPTEPTAPSPFLSSTIAVKGESVTQLSGTPILSANLSKTAFSAFGHPSLNNAGHPAFVARVSGPAILPADAEEIWAETGTGGWITMARTGVQAPGIARGAFTALNDPVYNDNEQIAFRGTFNASVPGVIQANAPGIWAAASGSLTAIAGVGEQAPGCIRGALFASFTQLALPAQGRVILLATLTGAGVTPANDEGLWAVNAAGELRLVVRKGNTLTVNDTPKSITALSVLTSSPVTMAQPGSFNSFGDLVYKATFSDHTQGIFSVVFP